MYVLGVDIGYSNLNISMGDASASAPTTLIHPVGAAPKSHLPQDVIGRGSNSYIEVEVSAQPWGACIEPSRLENRNRILADDYPSTEIYQALLRAALAQTERSSIDLLVTGLPVRSYQEAGEVERLASQMRGRHRIREGRFVDVAQVEVIPQPVGSYLDYMLEFEREDDLSEARVLVLDPGFFSVDWVQMYRHEILARSSGTSTEATSRVLEEAVKEIHSETGVRVARERIEENLRAGKETVFAAGQQLDVKGYLKQAAQRVAPTVIDAIQGSLRGGNETIDIVLLTGGGAPFYEAPLRQAFPNSQVVRPKNPVASNARGYFWYGVSVAEDVPEEASA